MLKVLHVSPSLEQGGAERMLHVDLVDARDAGVSHQDRGDADEAFFDFSGHDIPSLGFDLSSRAKSLAHLPVGATRAAA